MNRLRGASSRAVMGSIALSAVAALSLTGCSGDDPPTPNNSSGSTSSSSPGTSSGAPKDESEAVLGWTPPAPVAKTEGKLAARAGQEKSPTVPATAEVVSVEANDASTILTWQLSSSTDLSVRSWPTPAREGYTAGSGTWPAAASPGWSNTRSPPVWSP